METTAAAEIELAGVRKEYPGGSLAVSGLDLVVPAGSLTVLVGPSGSGKSTVLRMVNRLITPTAGVISLDGQDVATSDVVALRRKIGYVIQHVGLFPHQTVAQNVATVPKLLGWSRQRVTARVGELLELVGLSEAEHGKRYPHQLSGGQRQRVGVARALAADPVVLLMDEPFSAVDPIVRGRLQQEFLRLQETVRKTILLVTHDVDEAVRLGDHIAVLSEGGKLEQFAPPVELLARPANSFVAEFVGSDRGIKRLSVTPIPREGLRPVSDDASPRLPVTGTLYDALAALLEGGTGHVVITDGTNELGAMSADDVYAASVAA